MLDTNMNPKVPTESITDIREKADMTPNQALPTQNNGSGGVIPDPLKAGAERMGKL